MALFIQIHPENPQQRLINQAASMLRKGGILVYPTDSCYAIGCHIGDKAASEKIRRIRQLHANHHFTLMCSDLAEVGLYAKLDNPAFRLIKNITPGSYTFVMQATKEVPKRLLTPKRKTIGVRIPDNKIALELISALGEPIISTTLMLPNDEYPLTDPYEMNNLLGNDVNMIIDGGYCGLEPTTVVDMLGDVPVVIREGLGDVSVFNE